MAKDGFVEAVDPAGNKRRVPTHYLDNPAFGYKLPPSTRAKEPAEEATTPTNEPAAKPAKTKE